MKLLPSTTTTCFSAPPTLLKNVIFSASFQENSILPSTFQPLQYSVICGRGKKCRNAIGNRRLQVIASNFILKYSNAKSKSEKSSVVTSIVDIIRDACPIGAFIKYENGSWIEVDDTTARDKVGAILRESLYTKYKSASKSKTLKRLKEQNQRVLGTGPESCNNKETLQSKRMTRTMVQEQERHKKNEEEKNDENNEDELHSCLQTIEPLNIFTIKNDGNYDFDFGDFNDLSFCNAVTDEETLWDKNNEKLGEAFKCQNVRLLQII